MGDTKMNDGLGELMEYIRGKILRGEYATTEHFMLRCEERSLDPQIVIARVADGKIIEDYPDDQRGHSSLILANTPEYALHVLVGVAYIEMRMITVYRPDGRLWEDGFERRR